jgi:hypothetical protein
MPQFYLTIKVDNLKILRYFTYFLNLYLHRVGTSEESRVGFELFENGVVIIYDDEKTFRDYTHLNINDLRSTKEVIKKKLGLFPKRLFPEAGIKVSMKAHGGSGSDVFNDLKAYFVGVHCDFSFTGLAINDFLLHCPHYEAFYAFLADFMTRYSKSL